MTKERSFVGSIGPATLGGRQRVRVILLDIDSVLVNHRSWDLPSSCDHAPADEDWVRAFNRIVGSPGAVIVVLTSTWRINRDLPEIREIVNARFGVEGEVIDVTPSIMRHSRQAHPVRGPARRRNRRLADRLRGQQRDSILRDSGRMTR